MESILDMRALIYSILGTRSQSDVTEQNIDHDSSVSLSLFTCTCNCMLDVPV